MVAKMKDRPAWGCYGLTSGPSTWAGDKGSFTFPTLQDGSIEAAESIPGGVARLYGQKKGQDYTGYWVSADGHRACDTEKHGSYNWGRLRFQFDPSYQTFRGHLGSCNAAPTDPWNASRIN